jgi:hypothetical protein
MGAQLIFYAASMFLLDLEPLKAPFFSKRVEFDAIFPEKIV